MAKIGNPDSAIQRVLTFAQKCEEYTGSPPRVVVVFQEDYDAMDLRHFNGKPYTVCRGPSVEEYMSRIQPVQRP